MLAIVLG